MKKHGKAIGTLKTEIDRLKASVAHLEAREEIMVVEAKAAAGAAAAQVMVASLSDIARRVGVLEERSATRRASYGRSDALKIK